MPKKKNIQPIESDQIILALQKILQEMEPIKIANSSVMQGRMTQDEFWEKMDQLLLGSGAHSVVKLCMVIALAFYLAIEGKVIQAFLIASIVAELMLAYMLGKRSVFGVFSNTPVYEDFTHMYKLNFLRKQLTHENTLESLKRDALLIEKEGIACCQERDRVAVWRLLSSQDEVLKESSLFVHTLYLRKDPKNEHTVLVFSPQATLDSRQYTKKSFSRWVKENQDIIVFDPWYKDICKGGADINTAEKPLLAFPIEKVDSTYSLQTEAPRFRKTR